MCQLPERAGLVRHFRWETAEPVLLAPTSPCLTSYVGEHQTINASHVARPVLLALGSPWLNLSQNRCQASFSANRRVLHGRRLSGEIARHSIALPTTCHCWQPCG